jgi:hypothetical protein
MVLRTAAGTARSAWAVILRTTGAARAVVIRGSARSAGSATGTARAVVAGRRRAVIAWRVTARRGRPAVTASWTSGLSRVRICYASTNT